MLLWINMELVREMLIVNKRVVNKRVVNKRVVNKTVEIQNKIILMTRLVTE